LSRKPLQPVSTLLGLGGHYTKPSMAFGVETVVDNTSYFISLGFVPSDVVLKCSGIRDWRSAYLDSAMIQNGSSHFADLTK